MSKEKIIEDLRVILKRTTDLQDSIELLIADLEKQSQYPQNDNVDYGLIEDIIRKIVSEQPSEQPRLRIYPSQPIPQNPIIQPYTTTPGIPTSPTPWTTTPGTTTPVSPTPTTPGIPTPGLTTTPAEIPYYKMFLVDPANLSQYSITPSSPIDSKVNYSTTPSDTSLIAR